MRNVLKKKIELKKLWAVEDHCVVYHLFYLTRNKEIFKCIHTLLAIHWAVLIKTFHFVIISDWNLIYCPIVGNQSSFGKYWLHRKQSQVLSKQVLSNLIHFQNVCLCESCDMLYVREIAQNFLVVTDVYFFMLIKL